MCRYCEYTDNYEWMMSINMSKVSSYLDMMVRTRINPVEKKLTMVVGTESDGSDNIMAEMPVNYCPVCGRSMNADNLIESMGGAELVAKEIFSKISDLVAGATANKPEESEKVTTELPGYKPKVQYPKSESANTENNIEPIPEISKEREQADWQNKKNKSDKILIKEASADWDAFFDMAVTDVPIPDQSRLRVGLYNVGVKYLGNDPTKLSTMSNKQIRDANGVGKTYRPWVIKLRDYAKEVC